MRGRFVIYFAAVIIIFNSGCSPKLLPSVEKPEETIGFDTADYNIIFNDALRQKMLGNQANAIRLFERALKLNPGSDASSYQLSVLYQSAGDPGNAIKYGVRAAQIDAENSWYIHNAGILYYMVGRSDSAVYFFEKLTGLEPEREDYKLTLEGLYEQTGQYEKARDIVNEFIEKYGEEEELLVGLVRINTMWNKPGETENAIIRMINSDANKLKSYGLLAEFFKQQNREEEAAAIYDKLLNSDTENPELILSYIDFLRAYKKYDELIALLSSAIINDSIKIEGKLNLFTGILNDRELLESRPNEIELMTLLFVSNYNNIPEVVLMSAQIFESINKSDRAANVLRDYCEKNPENYLMWERLLFVYNTSANIDELYVTAKYVATKFNLYPLPKLLYAYAASERKEYELAIDELAKALTLSKGQDELLVQHASMLASILYDMGKYDEAFQTYAKGVELYPDNALLLNNYAYYLSEQGLELKEARKMIERCLSIESNSTYLDTYAWILYKLGKYKKADGIMNGIYEASAMESADHYEHYAYIKKAQGECKAAIEYWKIAMDMDSERTYLEKEIEQCQNTK